MNLTKGQWNEPGGGYRVYPLEERPNIINCNTYIIADSGGIAIIDHGGTPERAALIESVVGPLLAEQPRPVAALFTHSHMDHLGGIRYYSPEFRRKLTVILNRASLDIFANTEDVEMRNYFRIFGVEAPEIVPDLLLFADTPQFAGGFSLEKCESGEKIMVGGREFLRAWQAPGHTPDCLFFAAAGMIFVGDAFYALNPGIVGMPGWNASQYKQSLQLLKRLFADAGFCCPGHDRARPAADFEPALDELIFKSAHYRSVIQMTPERVEFLEEYARMLLKEIERFFTIIAGRLYLLGHELENAGENELAADFYTMMEFDEIENILAKFRQSLQKDVDFNQRLINGLKGIQAVQRIRRVLEGNRFESLISPSLFRRTVSLMNDFTNSLSGLPFTGESSEIELNGAVDEFIRELLETGDISPDIPQAVAKKFAALNIFRKVDFAVMHFPPELRIKVSEEHFFDAVQHICEHLIGAKAKTIKIQVVAVGLVITSDNFTIDTGKRIMQGYAVRALQNLNCNTGCGPDGIYLLFPFR